MASVNKVIVVGHLGKDPEVRYRDSGDAVANFSLATSETWKDKSGTKQEKTEWHRVVFFGRTAEVAAQYLKKGSLVYVEGRIQTKRWTDKEGVERYSTEIVGDRLQMLGGTRDRDEAGESRGPSKQQELAPKRDAELDDDIPF